MLQVFNAVVAIIICGYFYYVSNNWMWLQVFAWITNLLCLFALYILPESPKYLISRGRFDDARKVLKVIARVNKQPEITHYKFDREAPIDKNG